MMRSTCPNCGSLLVVVNDSTRLQRRWYCRNAIGAELYDSAQRKHYMPADDPHTVVYAYTEADLVRLEQEEQTA
jgi:hypothetical protein